jgi:8-oxo-dGTP diphosphatase
MELLKIIRDENFPTGVPEPATYGRRETARAVVFDKDKKIALLNVTKKNYHKLPGGGVEEGEDIETALHRELQEEIGCSATIMKEVGLIEEFRNEYAVHQISHCYTADVQGEKGAPQFERGEIADGFVPEWVSLEEAIQILENESEVDDYEGKFIRLREVTFLKAALEIVN